MVTTPVETIVIIDKKPKKYYTVSQETKNKNVRI